MKQNNIKSVHYRISVFNRVAYITGGFAVLLMLLLITNFLQIKSNDPLELQSLNELLEQYDADSKNEVLKEEIRNLDLLARKAFFTNEWQLRTGGVLLLVFTLVSLSCFRTVQSLKFKLELPDGEKKENEWQQKTDTRNAMSYIGIFLIGLVAVVYYFSDKEFNRYLQNPSAEVAENEIPENQQKPIEGIAEESSTIAEPEKGEDIEEQTKEEVGNANNENPEKPNFQPAPQPTTDLLKVNHVGFRGYRGQGVSYSKNIPVEWDGASGKNVKWKTQIPRSGYSSPIIWNDLVFITGGDDVAREVYCFNRKTGKIIWTVLVDNIPGSPSQAPKVTDDTGLAASTMTTDGTYVFAIFATGDVICLDMKGKKIWAKNLGVPDNHYGHSSSLLCYKDLLYIQYDDNNSGKLIGLDTKTGNEKFRTKRTSSISWTSPILIERAGQMEVVIDSDPGVAGYDAVTGKEKWKVECLTGEIGASPAYNGTYVFVSNEYAKMVAVKPGNNASIVWEGYDDLPEVSSPVANEKILITATSFGAVGCFDVNTGNKLWGHDFGEGFYASPILVEGKIYLMDMTGIMHIFKASETFELIAQPSIGEPVVSTPAFIDGNIYIRGNKNLYCISETLSDESEQATEGSDTKLNPSAKRNE